MRILHFPSNQLFRYNFTGKFQAPSNEWKHEKFPLGEYELIVMTEGELYLSYDNENFTVKAGEYLILPPSNSYREGFRSAYSSFYWLHFVIPTEDIPASSQTSDTSVHSVSVFSIPQTGMVPKLEKMIVLMKQLQDCAKNNYPAFTLNSMTTSIAAELYGQLMLNHTVEASTPNYLQNKQIYLDIIDYIQLHISRNIKVSEIAEHFNYNEKYISHLFASMTGLPLKQFILNKKMDAANFFLTDTNMSISDIAKAVGFTDSHNFSRSYKKITGLSPSEYRNTYAKRMLYDK